MLIGSSQLPVRWDSVAQYLQAQDFSVTLYSHGAAPKVTIAGPSVQAAQAVQVPSAAQTQHAHLHKFHPQPSQLSATTACSSVSMDAPACSSITTSKWCNFLLGAFLSSPQHPATNQMFLYFSLPRYSISNMEQFTHILEEGPSGELNIQACT